MNESARRRELEFELAVTGHLEDEYGLCVHVDGDALNRRRSGYGVLSFRYEYPSGSPRRAQVHVSVVGSQHSQTFSVDLGDADAVTEVASLCEDLAPHIRALLDKPPYPPGGLGRREED
jgi:hypothetical protein